MNSISSNEFPRYGRVSSIFIAPGFNQLVLSLYHLPCCFCSFPFKNQKKNFKFIFSMRHGRTWVRSPVSISVLPFIVNLVPILSVLTLIFELVKSFVWKVHSRCVSRLSLEEEEFAFGKRCSMLSWNSIRLCNRPKPEHLKLARITWLAPESFHF